MKGTFITHRTGWSGGCEGENEFVVECEFYVQRDAFGTGDSPSEWTFHPLKVTCDGLPYTWEELDGYEQEDIEDQAYSAYLDTNGDRE